MELSIIQSKIYEIRGSRIMLDFDLAELYQIPTKALKQAVRRNIGRFPEDFMFELQQHEWKNLRSQIVTSSWGGIRFAPFAFTEQGVAMLSSVLRSEIAIDINISIMRAFVAVRNYLSQHAETSKEIAALWQHVKALEERSEENLKAINDLNDENQNAFDEIYIALSELAKKQKAINEPKPYKPIGYIKPKEK
ncbi:MAG: ORF6N domain-containing protein [Prevotella sp.]|nr:ORF6N domain-containing protein [Prevotella sp.]